MMRLYGTLYLTPVSVEDERYWPVLHVTACPEVRRYTVGILTIPDFDVLDGLTNLVNKGQ